MQTMQTPHICAAAVAAVVCTNMGCTVPPPPTSPSGPGMLQIQGTTLLMVGGRGQLRALASFDEDLRQVPATWTVEGDAVTVTSAGAVVARALGRATVRARYRDLAGETVVHVVQSVAGTWRGAITVVDCWVPVPVDPDPCEGRRGLTAPLVLRVTQSTSADLYDNLRATVDVFTPPATGTLVGALDSSGFFFLEGVIERSADGLTGFVNFKWQLEDDRLVPFTFNVLGDDKIDVNMSTGKTPATLFTEIWQLSNVTR